jgi:hypothetical protein
MQCRTDCTAQKMADACEMLVAAELTLAGVPSLRVPDLWPSYYVIAQPSGREPQRISVKSRAFKPGPAYVSYDETDIFDWLAIVILPGNTETRRRLLLIPRTLADAKARRDKPMSKTANERYWRIDEVSKTFAKFEDNFTLQEMPRGRSVLTGAQR